MEKVAFDQVFGSLNALTPTLDSLDERGLVLSLAAFAEEALGHLLTTYMLGNASAEKLLKGFNAPFGTFSTRIKGCHALGLIEDSQAGDLELLRKIRNEFAHSWQTVSLDGQKNRSLVEAISYPLSRHDFPSTPRQKLVLSISFLLGELRSTDARLAPGGNVAKAVPSRLIAGSIEESAAQLVEMHDHVVSIENAWPDSKGARRDWLRGQAWYWINRAPIISREGNSEHGWQANRLARRLVFLTGLLSNEVTPDTL